MNIQEFSHKNNRYDDLLCCIAVKLHL